MAQDPTATQAPAPAPAEPQPPAKAAADPVQRLTRGLLVAALVVLVYVLIAQRLTPMSRDGALQAYLVRMSPEVAGRVVAVAVVDNQKVAKGDLLFRLDPAPYELAVKAAEAQLASAGQGVGADTATVQAAQAKVAQAQAVRNNAREQVGRINALAEKGVVSKAQHDQALTELATAEASLAAAQADLGRAKSALGPAGDDNPRLREALAKLDKARLDLIRTEVIAPGNGVITNVQLSPGQYAAVGSPAMTYLDTDAIWISVLMDENGLEYLKREAPAEILFDALPGRVYQAQVESTGWGIAGTINTDSSTGLLIDNGNNADRRFPVTVVLQERPDAGLRYGSKATVVVYSTDHSWFNAITWLWMRVLSLLAYIF